MPKWIEFVLKEKKEKTDIYNVIAKADGSVLGEISWFGKWRQYAFFPAPDTVYEKTCLEDIKNFLLNLMEQRKENKKGTA